MFEIIDLSQEIFTGMPTFPGMPEVKVTVHWSHEQLEGVTDGDTVSPAVNLHRLVGRGRFRFVGLPLKIRGGTGSPVRAIAVFGE